MLLNEYLNRFRKGIQKFENYGYADSVDIRDEIFDLVDEVISHL